MAEKPVSLYEEAAAEIEELAKDWRHTNARYAYFVEPGSGVWLWPNKGDEEEYNRLMDLVRRLRKAARRPDPLGEALNSGDGSYRP